MKIISFIYFPEARPKGTIFFVARSVFLVKLPGCTGQIFGYFAKKICRQFPETSAPDVVYFQILSRLTKPQRRRRPASGQDKFLSGVKSDRYGGPQVHSEFQTTLPILNLTPNSKKSL